MKKIFLLAAILSFVLLGCSKKDDNTSNTTILAQITTNVKVGNWRVTKHIDSGTDKTASFNGYTFNFGASNVLTATSGSNVYTGTWIVSDSNSNDDSISDIHFVIAISGTNNLTDLTDDWNIISQTTNKIELIDASGGNGGTDYLTFEKN